LDNKYKKLIVLGKSVVLRETLRTGEGTNHYFVQTLRSSALYLGDYQVLNGSINLRWNLLGDTPTGQTAHLKAWQRPIAFPPFKKPLFLADTAVLKRNDAAPSNT